MPRHNSTPDTKSAASSGRPSLLQSRVCQCADQD